MLVHCSVNKAGKIPTIRELAFYRGGIVHKQSRQLQILKVLLTEIKQGKK